MMGDQDYVFLEPVRQLIKKQPHSQLVILDDCGHVCNVDQATAFNSLTTQFLFNKEQRLVS